MGSHGGSFSGVVVKSARMSGGIYFLWTTMTLTYLSAEKQVIPHDPELDFAPGAPFLRMLHSLSLHDLTDRTIMRTSIVTPLMALLVFAPRFSPALPGEPPALSDRVVQYAIDVTLDSREKTLSGSERLTWRNTSSGAVQELQFHMYLNAFKNTESTFMREAVTRRSAAVREGGWGWMDLLSLRLENGTELKERCTFISPDDGNAKDRTVMRVPLPAPVPPGGSITLTVKFHAQLPRIIARTGYSGDFFMVGQWFPKVGVYEPAGTRYATKGEWNCHQFHASTEFYADFGAYDVHLTVPGGFIVGATGARRGERRNPDSTVTYTYHAADVHDFAWTASPLYVEANDTWRGVSIHALLQPQHAGQARRFLGSAKEALGYLDTWVGPYPYADLTIVDPAWGAEAAAGMEYPELITVETFSLMPLGVRLPEMATIHEFAHQYFYGMVATNEFEEAWMDEGFTQYYETRIMDSLYGAKASAGDLFGFHFGDLEFTRILYTSMNDPGIAPITTPGWKFPAGSYSPLTYAKTAMVLSTLEGLIGRPAMDSVMKTYFRRWKFRHPCGRDFVAVVNTLVPVICGDRFGPDMNWFFDRVLYGTGVCDFEITSIAVTRMVPMGGRVDGDTAQTRAGEDRSGGSPEMFESVVTVAQRGDVRLPVVVAIRFDDGREVREDWDGRARTAQFRYGGKVVRAAVDPGRKIPLDVNLINNVRSAPIPIGPVWKYAVKVLFWVQNIFLLAATIS
jgi:hypothetical protein